MLRFHSDIPALYLPEEMATGALIPLPDEEARHVRALRLWPGDHLLLLDGCGGRIPSKIERIDRHEVIVRVGNRVLDEAETRPYIALGIGILSDKARFEWVVEKGVELGAREIIPLLSERSEGRIHRERALRVAVAALKQSQRSFLPIIAEPTPLAALLCQPDRFQRLYLCHESAPDGESLARSLLISPDRTSMLLLIGPEGGFSDNEIASAKEASARIVSLGDVRLRAETAALMALALATSLGDLNATRDSSIT